MRSRDTKCLAQDQTTNHSPAETQSKSVWLRVWPTARPPCLPAGRTWHGRQVQPQRLRQLHVLRKPPGWAHAASGLKGFPARAWLDDLSFTHKHPKGTGHPHGVPGGRIPPRSSGHSVWQKPAHTSVLAAKPEIGDLHVNPLVLSLSTASDAIRRASRVSLMAPALAGVCAPPGGSLQALPMSVFCTQATWVFKSQHPEHSLQVFKSNHFHMM